MAASGSSGAAPSKPKAKEEKVAEKPRYLLFSSAYLEDGRYIDAVGGSPVVLDGYEGTPSVNWKPLNTAAVERIRGELERRLKDGGDEARIRSRLKALKVEVEPAPDEVSGVVSGPTSVSVRPSDASPGIDVDSI